MYDNEYAYQSLLLVMVVRADILPSLASWPAVIRHDADIQAMTSTSPKYSISYDAKFIPLVPGFWPKA